MDTLFVTCSCLLWAEGLSLQVVKFGCFICRNGSKVHSCTTKGIKRWYNLHDSRYSTCKKDESSCHFDYFFVYFLIVIVKFVVFHGL
ncbi:hypothetical protein Hanom_Chr16g01416041 [Helianthus anomalus]